nr:hypothetical protein [Tanacetum cinerariifolium]
MSSPFAESHNMVAILEKLDDSEGFEKIIDFLSGSYINHALTVNPHVYISCIKQFWNTAVVKRSGDVTRLQALVDKKRIVIIEEVVHEILQLNDAKRINIADLSTHTTRYISLALTQKVFANMRRIGKGFSGVETPLFESMLVVRDVAEETEAHVPAQGADVQEPTAEEVVTEVVPPTPTPPSPLSPNDKAAHQLEIVKLKARVKKLEKINKVKSSKLRRLKKVRTSQRVKSLDDMENVFNQGRIIADMDQDEGIELVTDQEKDAKVEGRHELPSDTPVETPKVKDKGKGILIEALKPMKKKDQIEMDAEYARKLQEESIRSMRKLIKILIRICS